MSQKSYINHWKAACNFRDRNRGVKFLEFHRLSLDNFESGLTN